MKKVHPNGVDDSVKVNLQTDYFHCETCGGQYTTKRFLEKHVCLPGASTGPSQSDCVICTASFQSRFQVVRHIEEVHAERLDKIRWKCLVCKIIVQGQLLIHVESVHTSTNSKCYLCEKVLKNRRCLRSHIYTVHENGGEIKREKRKLKKLEQKIEHYSI